MSKKVPDKFYDELILKMLKNGLDINKSGVNILKGEKLSILCERIENKKQTVLLLFENEFAESEFKINCIMNNKNNNSDYYDRVANNILLKRINRIFQKLLEDMEDDGQYVSVCLDRNFFINKVLEKNVSLEDVKKCIKEEENERD